MGDKLDAMALGGGAYSKWPGIILNALIFLVTGILFYELSRKLIKDPLLQLLPLMLLAVVPLAIATTVFLRMYELLILTAVFLLTTTHSLVYEQKSGPGSYFVLAASVALGLLTQYYFLLLAFWVFITSAVILFRSKGLGSTLRLAMAFILGAGLAWAINPSMLHNLIGS